MRATAKLGSAILSAVALLAAVPVAPASGAPGDVRASSPSLFTQAGYTRHDIDAKVSAAWQQLFHGSPGTDPGRYDGQAVYYQLTPDMAYVEDIANHDVRTEGMGYAMMIAVQLGHRREFDALWNFAKTKMQIQSGPEQYYFAWHTDTTGKVLSTGVAPDGDQWIAAALCFASNRWGDGSGDHDYGGQARQILHAMWHASDSGGVAMFDRERYLPVFSPPNAVGYTDPSYSLPAFYRVFAVADPADKDLWTNAYNAGEQLLEKAANPSTGLAPDYAHFDGSPYLAAGDNVNDNAYDHNFQEDAWRAIANANVDAAWFGVKPWQTQYSNTLEHFFAGQGVTTYVSRYHLDGTPLSQGQNDYEPAHAQGLVAMNSASAISATNAGRLEFVRDFWNAQVPSGQARYYDGLLYLLGLLYDSGQFKVWTPGT